MSQNAHNTCTNRVAKKTHSIMKPVQLKYVHRHQASMKGLQQLYTLVPETATQRVCNIFKTTIPSSKIALNSQ